MFPYFLLITFVVTLTNNTLFAMDGNSSPMAHTPRSPSPVDVDGEEDELLSQELTQITASPPSTPKKHARRSQTVVPTGRISRCTYDSVMQALRSCSVQVKTIEKTLLEEEERVQIGNEQQEVSPSKRTSSGQSAETPSTPHLRATSSTSSAATPHTPGTPGLPAFRLPAKNLFDSAS